MMNGIGSFSMDPASRMQAIQSMRQEGGPSPEQKAEFESKLAERGLTLEDVKAKMESRFESGSPPEISEELEAKLAEKGLTVEDFKAKMESRFESGMHPDFLGEEGLDAESMKAKLEERLSEQGLTLEDLRAKAESFRNNGASASSYDRGILDSLMQQFGNGTRMRFVA